MDESSWRATLAQALAARDLATVRRIPKADLHCHGSLSAPIETYEQLAGQALPPVPKAFGGFEPFGDYIATNLLPILARGRSVVAAVIRAAFERFVADGVTYAEPSFDLLLPGFIEMSVGEFAALLVAEAARLADRIIIAPEIGIDRSLPPEAIRPLLREWLDTGVFRSLDLYANENDGVIDEFVPLYRLAADYGLKLKAHAGELCGPDRVRESVQKLDLHAVQHGVRAVESADLVAHLAQRGTLLHLCPTSNCSLGVCATYATHPARDLFDGGVRLTVNSDDYTLFGVGVSEELLNLTRMGFTPDDIVKIVDIGLAERPT